MKSKRKNSKAIFSISIAIIISQLLTLTAFACTTAHLNGKYTTTAPANQANLRFLRYPSTNTTMLTSAVFANPGWNSSSNPAINVNITNFYVGIPNESSYFPIYGEYISPVGGGVLAGELRTYNLSGNVVSGNSDWHRVVLIINTHPGVFDYEADARKAFIHEVGHAIKLSHPDCSTRAVMHQGAPTTAGAIAPTVQSHDTNNRDKKWG